MVQRLPETTEVFDLSSRACPKNASHVRSLFLRVGSTRGSLLENHRLPTRKPTGPFERYPVLLTRKTLRHGSRQVSERGRAYLLETQKEARHCDP
ncbi:hypothetical protein ALC56_10870 [Trachymyrmex septentrionalis]|uniref:Uncharacterized protein n=1 Tax=Trachymyrmex septentrionalis TaxID=34720 RepID=A0A195F407_9HYME|nr:hypothetical protein ALC56_10870 [Trachymyrmex septentrionalis]